MAPNIAQVEFMLFKGDCPESIWREVRARARDGRRIKQVVRFPDMAGRLTHYTTTFELMRKREKYLLRNFLKFSAIGRWWANLESRWLARLLLRLDGWLPKVAAEELVRAIQSKQSIAIEDAPGDPFRLVQANELHEIIETAKAAKGAWSFIFRPMPILADSGSILAAALL